MIRRTLPLTTPPGAVYPQSDRIHPRADECRSISARDSSAVPPPRVGSSSGIVPSLSVLSIEGGKGEDRPRQDGAVSDRGSRLPRILGRLEGVTQLLLKLEREAIDYVPPGEIRQRSLVRW